MFCFRENTVGSGAHNEEVRMEEAVGVIQVTDNKRPESERCHEKGGRFKSLSKGKFERIW